MFNRVFIYHPGITSGKVLYQDPEVSLEDDDKGDDEDNNEEEESTDDDVDEDGEDKDDDDKEDKENIDEEGTARVEFSAIKEKYPNFFKDFPDLRHAFFREQQFTEIFPTIEEAQKAAQEQLQYEEITGAVVSGDVGKFLTELGTESKEGLEKFVTNFIPALLENDRDLYYDVATPIVRNHIREVFAIGVRNKDTNVANASKIVHKMLFGGEYDDIEKEVPLNQRRTREKKEPDEDKETKELNQRQTEKYSGLYQEITGILYGALDKELEKGLDDLKDRPGLKRAIMKDAKERILAEMEKDKNYLGRINSLWQREQRLGFNGSLKQSFQTTFMGKARTLITKSRIDARKEVLGKEDKGKNNKEPNRPGSGKETSRTGKKWSKEDIKGKTSLDIFKS